MLLAVEGRDCPLTDRDDEEEDDKDVATTQEQ